MLRIYRMPNGRTFQFDEKDVPAGAVLVEPDVPKKTENKKIAPRNKAVTPKNKAVKSK